MPNLVKLLRCRGEERELSLDEWAEIKASMRVIKQVDLKVHKNRFEGVSGW